MDCFVVAFLAMTNGGLQASSQRKHKTKNPAAFAAGFFNLPMWRVVYSFTAPVIAET